MFAKRYRQMHELLLHALQAIMLVESVDGQSALLGRPRSLTRRGPVLTCLSGFIEQGESIEEAVRMIHILYPKCSFLCC